MKPSLPAIVTAPGVTYRVPEQAPRIHQSERADLGVPLWLVIHSTEGPANAALAWWCSPNNPYKSSAHDLVDWDGVVWRCVPYNKAAHHAGGTDARIPGVPAGSTAGTSNTNHASIGIELQSDPAPLVPGYTATQIAAAVAHIRAVVQAFGIPRERIIRHADVDPKNRSDPRGLDWEAFMDQVFNTVKPPTAEEVRNEAWKALGIPYNPEAAFAKYAREHCLGVPMTPEFDFSINGVPYRGQGFAECVLYCKTGDWGNIEELDW